MDFNIQVYKNIISIIPSGYEYIPDNKVISVTIYPALSGYMVGLNEHQKINTTYKFWFTSRYCPLFTTVKRVRLEAGPIADSLIDDTIYRMIHKNSLDVIELYNLAYNTSNTSTSFGCDASVVPFNMKRYVECKTAYDILSLIDQVSGSSGNQLKTLGDLTIKYSTPSAKLATTDPSRKKQLYDCWNSQIDSIRTVVAAVRGIYDCSKGYIHPVMLHKGHRVLKPEIGVADPFSTPGTSHWRRI